ncbi:MAG: HD domain-containing protein [Patescibacteria group bacterium]
MTERQLFKKIYEVSKALNAEVYVVGGYVRDELLGLDEQKEVKKEISRVQAAWQKDLIEGGVDLIVEEYKEKKDIDFVVLGGGLEFAKKFDEVLNQSASAPHHAGATADKAGSLVEFSEFDTARYILSDFEIEFAGARKEKYQEKSRKPSVAPATLAEDLSRRDFTVNALARKVLSTKLGEIVDPYGGQMDLEKKLLRTPLDPNETFSEDPLRMLRAARFASQLGFGIEARTYEALRVNHGRLRIVSAERVQEELFKLLATPQPSIGLAILFETELLKEFLPEVARLDGVEEVYGEQHKNNLWHSFKVVDNLATRTNKPLLRFAGLTHDIGKPGTKQFARGRGWTFDMHEHLGRKLVRQIGRRLRMSVADTEYVAKLVRWHQQPINLMDEGITDSAVRRLVFNLGLDIDDLLKLCRSDITTGNPRKRERRLRNYDILEEKILRVIEKDKLREFQSPIRGEEIMKACGLKAGPTIGKIKKAIEEAILDGIIPNEEESARKFFLEIKNEFVEKAEGWELTDNG